MTPEFHYRVSNYFFSFFAVFSEVLIVLVKLLLSVAAITRR